MDQDNNVAAAIDAGQKIADASKRITLDVAGVPIAILPEGMKAEVMSAALELADARAERPRRRVGTATHEEIDSFIAHANRFKDASSAIFAAPSKTSLTAVFDYHEAAAGAARWGKHRSVYTCPQSAEWKRWLSLHDKALKQDDFATFIDANMSDLVGPENGGAIDEGIASPGQVLDMARNLIVRTKGTFERSVNPTTGESMLVNKTENTSESTKIPRAFFIAIPVLEGGDRFRVEARIRFALKDGQPTFSYSLFEWDRILRTAFLEVRTKVAAETSLPVFVGAPE